jgi:hypothetical protein
MSDNEEMPLETPETQVELMEIMDNGEKKFMKQLQYFLLNIYCIETCIFGNESFDQEKSAIYEFFTNGRISRNGKF